MGGIHKFTFGPFAENTFLVDVASGQTVAIDPGMSNPAERTAFDAHLTDNGLTLSAVLLTHAHLDHVAGLDHCHRVHGCTPRLHPTDLETYRQAPLAANLYGFPLDDLPTPQADLAHGDILEFDNCSLEIRFAPGHAPGHVVFINHADRFVIGGDVLFNGSIGRTDLPGGDMQTLLDSIRRELYSLDDDYTVFCGHGPETTIGAEKRSNPFVRG